MLAVRYNRFTSAALAHWAGFVKPRVKRRLERRLVLSPCIRLYEFAQGATRYDPHWFMLR
jgi:hypothetical protein